MKIEESERLAALLTAHEMTTRGGLHYHDAATCMNPKAWREQYQKRLREFMELERAEHQEPKE